MTAVAAIDLGATSGRVIAGTVDGGLLRTRAVARFPNEPVRLADGLHWDLPALWAAAMRGVAEASRAERLVGAAVDSWAVDYGLTRGDALLGLPMHYRDARTASGVDRVHAAIGPAALWRRNGLAHQPFNTVFQLAADDLLDVADSALLIPDLVGWWATGTRVAEATNASTTGLVADGGWDADLLARLTLPSRFPAIVPPGSDLGPVSPAVRHEFGVAGEPRFSTVGSHDTASAVVGVPLAGDDAVYISSGTWSLVGAELERPVVTDAARDAGFTNEGGVDGRTRFLKNVMGLWLLSESLRDWRRGGRDLDLDDLLRQAADAPADQPRFDANDPRLLAPGDMPARIATLIAERGGRAPDSPAEFVRCVLQNLADAYAEAVRDVARLTGRPVRTVHVVGGGARNALLCRLTAAATGLDVVAGPVEATAIGNLLVQARTHGLLTGDLEALRAVVARSFPPRTFAAPTPSIARG